MRFQNLLLAAPLAVVLACGGSATTGTGSAALDAAVPTYQALSLDQTTIDDSAPAVAVVAEAVTAEMSGPGGCHPHLFVREREVVERVNRHVYKVLRLVERLVANSPSDATSISKTWAKVESGVEISFTITLVSPSVYGWELAAGPAGTTPLPVVMTGEIDRNGYAGPHEGKGSMSVDFAKLHAAFPRERASSGTLAVEFDVSAASRTISVVATDVTWELDASKFDGGTVPAALAAPRSGAYVYHRQAGKGGSLKIQDQMVFLCNMDSRVDNASLVPADAQVVSRWFVAADGRVKGRSDGLITGGNLVAPVDRIVGVTCRNASADRHMPSEGYWLMKAESSDGATVVGFNSMMAGDPSATPCDPAFGPVPTLADASNDFTAWPASYADGVPYPFPAP